MGVHETKTFSSISSFYRLHRWQIRDTVGSENIEVYHTVLGLLRQCSEEGDPVKLFHQLKDALGEKWPHLIDEFVPFLQPDQVINVINVINVMLLCLATQVTMFCE